MKVTQTPAMPTMEQVVKAKTQDGGDGATFQRLLSKAGQVSGPADSTPPRAQAADPLAALEGMACVTRSQSLQGSCSEVAMKRIQAALDLLENYQQQLGDPQISLKEMMPVVSALERQIHDLRWSEDQPAIPEELARIASEVLVTAQVEVSKFYRGDYV